MVATIVPFGSEAYFSTLLLLNKYNPTLLLFFASLGNILGSVFNWICGYYANYFLKKKWFPISQKKITKATLFFSKYGKWSLLLSWVPLIGDPITFVAGTLRYSILPFVLLVSIGKIGRYLIIYLLIINFSNILMLLN
jgi:membrane protein YqaA with SNARE-associated domain|tara:strand:- start:95 stop:508 length:414 start_codon:yes stop_codon:yes gene_type:complete